MEPDVRSRSTEGMRTLPAIVLFASVFLVLCASGADQARPPREVAAGAAETLPEARPLFEWRDDCLVRGRPTDTLPNADRQGRITVEGLFVDERIGPAGVQTLRPDVFREGHFSVFDVLVGACADEGIDLRYHLAPELKTHVIDSLDGKSNWWYAASYHGGGRLGEEPVHRMDCHPYKDWMVIRVYPVPATRVEELHAVFRQEVQRIEANGGKTVVPVVTISVPGRLKREFKNVEVRPHGLRSDVFQDQVVTVADVMLSLAEQGKLTLDLDWLGTIGRTLVQGYYFTRFDDVLAQGRAGFTYSAGENAFRSRRGLHGRFGNNMFHMTADIRVVVCPEYVAWRWTDLSGSSRGTGEIRGQRTGRSE